MVRCVRFGQALICVAGCLISYLAFANTDPLTSKLHEVPKASSDITIDGNLDEVAWQTALTLPLEFEVRPGENIPPPVKTTCLVTYSKDALYVAFKAIDPNPEMIRARYSDRDSAWNDDWVGIVIDTFNDQRRAYELFSTPLGVQIDAINDETGGSYDDSWNAIWDSAGSILEDGYSVEMRIPFSQIRFQTVDGKQTWGFDAIRSYPRTDRHHITLFARDRGANSYLAQAVKLVGFEGVDAGNNLEIIPTATATRSESRAGGTSGPFETTAEDEELGLDVRWGITPNLTLNGTINPDFSQVEADAVQLDVNTTFALFFPETRPFFLEGADTFNTRFSLLNTRSIADPDGALKLTGKQGSHTWGILSAQDSSTSLILPGAERSRGGAFAFENTSTVGRYRKDFGSNSTIGGTVTDRRGDGYENQVLSVDSNWRPTDSDTIYFIGARSSTEYNDAIRAEFDDPSDPDDDLPMGEFSDEAYRLGYQHSKRTWNVRADYVSYGDGYRSDLGFQPQVGFDRWIAGGNYNWQGTESTFYNRISLGGDVDRTTTSSGRLIEEEAELFFNAQGPKESYLFLNLGTRNRNFRGTEYSQVYQSAFYEMRVSKMFYFNFDVDHGDWIDFRENREADRLGWNTELWFNFGKHLSLNSSYGRSTLDVEGGRLFRTAVSQLRAVYQFNRRMRLRAVLQHVDIARDVNLILDPDLAAATEPEIETLLSQLLFSYKLNGQSAFYLGYSDQHFGNQDTDLTTTDRTVFLKIGYAWLL